MKLKLLRVTEADTSTEGILSIDDNLECYTLEDTDRHLEDGGEKVYGDTAIPRGTYDVTISHSGRFNKFLIEVLNVPQFTGIRIHTGNSSDDTEGCILVGSVNSLNDDDWVGGSRIAYNQLHSKVENALYNSEKVTLEII